MSDPVCCTTPELARRHEAFTLIPHAVRLVARGEPVPLDRLAADAGRPLPDVERALHGLPRVDLDEAGRLVGLGLTLRPTRHRFVLAGLPLYTWCAMDTLEFVHILGRTATVESACPATGTAVRMVVGPDRVDELDPAGTVVSQLIPPGPVSDLRTAVCDQGHFFASAASASAWVTAHPGGKVRPVAEAHAAARTACSELGWVTP